MKQRFCPALVLLLCSLTASLFADDFGKHRITSVAYDIKGSTRVFPLVQAVPIDTDRVFPSRAHFETYIADLEIRLNNQRVFESATVETAYGDPESDGVIPVSIIVHTVDTWNIIALPYPKYDSNSGFELKLKFKDYNFFGSMQELNGDVNYKIGDDGKTAITSNIDFSIPFTAWGYSSNWKAEASVELPQDELPLWTFSTGFNIAFPVGWTAIVVGFDQAIVINDRNSESEYYENDEYYLKNTFYANVPFVVYTLDYYGDIILTPNAAVDFNWGFDGIQNNLLKGPELIWGYTVATGRKDWVRNFRSGLAAETETEWSYNLDHGTDVKTSVKGSVSGYTSIFDRIGLTGRTLAFYNLNGNNSGSAGEEMRGILNERIKTYTAVTFNVDLPIRIMRVNFEEMTGVSWTKYIGFEMHGSPFFDMTLSHDWESGRSYSLLDAWYSGGMELIVYPSKMRSIYGRVSVGFDLEEAFRSGSLSGYAERDGAAIRELFFGIGLHY